MSRCFQWPFKLVSMLLCTDQGSLDCHRLQGMLSVRGIQNKFWKHVLLRKMRALRVAFCVKSEETLLVDKHSKIIQEKES